jgi:hypothetical protein
MIDKPVGVDDIAGTILHMAQVEAMPQKRYFLIVTASYLNTFGKRI